MKRKKEKTPAPVAGLPPFPWKEASETDPLGSWTGVPENKLEIPVQDVDDL